MFLLNKGDIMLEEKDRGANSNKICAINCDNLDDKSYGSNDEDETNSVIHLDVHDLLVSTVVLIPSHVLVNLESILFILSIKNDSWSSLTASGL